MRMSRVWLSLLVAASLAACAALGPVPQAAIETPVPQGMARLVFYRELNPYDPLVWTAVSLNGEIIGNSAPGQVFYRDVAPGTYAIEARSDQLYPHQIKTVALAPDSTTYVRVETRPVWNVSGWQASGNTFVIGIVDPSVARLQIDQIRRTGMISG